MIYINRKYVQPTTHGDANTAFLLKPFSGDLEDVPGIGKMSKKLLATESDQLDFKPMLTSYQLMGKFLSLRTNSMSWDDHCQQFYIWLQEKGLKHHANPIVYAISEKAKLMLESTGGKCHPKQQVIIITIN